MLIWASKSGNRRRPNSVSRELGEGGFSVEQLVHRRELFEEVNFESHYAR